MKKITCQMNIDRHSTSDLIEIVSNLLESILQSNKYIPDKNITYFHSGSIPNISIASYLSRIHKFAPFSNEALISMLIYFDRITKSNHGLHINAYSIHRLIISSIVIASKFTSDIFYSNCRYAKVGGITLQELNQLEVQFLFLIEFRLYISLEDLQEYANQLLSHAIIQTTSQPNQKHQKSHILSIKPHSVSIPPYSSKPKRHYPYSRPYHDRKSTLLSPRQILL